MFRESEPRAADREFQAKPIEPQSAFNDAAGNRLRELRKQQTTGPWTDDDRRELLALVTMEKAATNVPKKKLSPEEHERYKTLNKQLGEGASLSNTKREEFAGLQDRMDKAGLEQPY